MQIELVSFGTLREFKEKNTPCSMGVGLLIFGFNGLGEVSYEKELKGESSFFEDVAMLSKAGRNIVICGCITDTRGKKRKSAVVAENGRLLGVSDMLNVIDGEFCCGADLKIYETGVGKIGVVVAEDLYFPEVIKSLSVCGCAYVVCVFGKVASSIPSVLIRSHAYCYGVPVLFCGEGYGMVADSAGNLALATPESPACLELKNNQEYHLIETRQRGFYRL